ncbi:MAG: hypothetical protein FWC71_04505 [Defluviitaleaceae bacterium]|nr:hypothetical protein [Defluviitaleaceae bacterium]
MTRRLFLIFCARRPLLAFLLCALVGLASFAFVARAAEYIVVRGELQRIEGMYRAIGVLTPLEFNDFTNDHDVTRAAQLIAADRRVVISDTRRFTTGILDRHTPVAVYQGAGAWGTFFLPAFSGLDMPGLEHYFIGTVRAPAALVRLGGQPVLMLNVMVDEMLQGDASVLPVGMREFTNAHGQTARISGRQDFRLRITEEEAEAFQRGEWNPLDVRVGEQYVFQAAPNQDFTYGRLNWNLRPLVGNDGLIYGPLSFGFFGFYQLMRIQPELRSNADDMRFFLPANDADRLEALLGDHLRLHEMNRSSVVVIETRDMTAVPRFTNAHHARLLHTSTFYGGRWLTYEDYTEGRAVAVVPMQLAIRSGLTVGETFTMTLRDTTQPKWLATLTTSPWAPGIEGWWNNYPDGWWAFTEAGEPGWQTARTHTIEVEVVGVYRMTLPGVTMHNFSGLEIYIPAGLIPEGFEWDGAPLLTGMYSFVLDSPRSEEAFVRDHQAALAALGFATAFLPTRFDHVVASIDPIRTSVTVNLWVFTAVAALVFVLAVYLYVRQWRKAVAVSRALGIPGRRVMQGLFVPVVCLWVPVVVIGALAGMQFAMAQANDALAGIGDYETTAINTWAWAWSWWLPLLIAGICVFILGILWLVGYGLLRRPVLAQLQGEAQAAAAKVVESGVVPKHFRVRNVDVGVITRTRLGGLRASVRYMWRHIRRAPVKTALACVLAVAFVFSLGWLDNTIRSTEAEIERLWMTTRIDAQIMRHADAAMPALHGWPAYIAPASWDAVYATGFVTDAYLEALAQSQTAYLLGVSHLAGFIEENTKTPLDEQLGVFCDDIHITFGTGWSAADFVYDTARTIPVLVRNDYFVEMGYTFGAPIRKQISTVYGLRNAELFVIGTFDGGLQRAVGRVGLSVQPLYVMPLEALQSLVYGHVLFANDTAAGLGTLRPPYMTARFIANPARNRELEHLRNAVDTPLAVNQMGGQVGQVPLELRMDDDIFQNVVKPMEQNLALMRLIYPIAVATAFALALGLSLLMMLQNAKNAALLRVLGRPKTATQGLLICEQLIVCVVGIIAAVVGIVLWGAAGSIAMLAAIYFAGAFIGSLAGAYVISTKAPLELLQVKE